MKTIITIGIASLLLVGCGTLEGLRSKEPEFKVSSTNGTKEVALCIADKWESYVGDPSTISMREKQVGHQVMMTCQYGPCLFADILPNGKGSTTTLYSTAVGASAMLDHVKSCQ